MYRRLKAAFQQRATSLDMMFSKSLDCFASPAMTREIARS
jgi:hypothetical protein